MPQMRKTLMCSFVLSLTETAKKSLAQSLELDVNSPSALQDYLSPKAEDYVRIPMRALSAAPDVQGGLFNFAHNGGQALKDSVSMFNGLTVLKDHRMSVENWVGHTEGAFWDESTAGAPPGVTFMAVIDTKADPKLARGLISGDINSGSVTIEFDYEPSHPNMSADEFYMKLGETVDGKLVQALITKVTRLYEYSIVWQGADKYAKTIQDGSIGTPGVASNSIHFSQSKEDALDLKKLALLLGLSVDNLTEDIVMAALNAKIALLATTSTEMTTLKTANTKLTADLATAQAELANKVTEITALAKQLDDQKPQVELGQKFLTDTRNEALRLYNLVEGTKATAAMQTLIKDASLEVAKSFVSSYGDRAEQIAPLHCTKCGSTELQRRTSASSEVPAAEGKHTDKLVNERLKSTVASIHG